MSRFALPHQLVSLLVSIFDVEGKRHVVYIDKPFIGKSFSNHDKNTLFHRLAVKSAFLHEAHVSAFSLEKKSDFLEDSTEDSPEEPVNSDLFGDASADLEDLETFGTDRIMHAAKNQEESKVNSADLEELETFGTDKDTHTDKVIKSFIDNLEESVDISGKPKTSAPRQSSSTQQVQNDSFSTDDDEMQLAIDVDRPLSPIISTDGQFDDVKDGASSVPGASVDGVPLRHSGRLSSKKVRSSVSSEGADSGDNRRRTRSMSSQATDDDSNANVTVVAGPRTCSEFESRAVSSSAKSLKKSKHADVKESSDTSASSEEKTPVTEPACTPEKMESTGTAKQDHTEKESLTDHSKTTPDCKSTAMSATLVTTTDVKSPGVVESRKRASSMENPKVKTDSQSQHPTEVAIVKKKKGRPRKYPAPDVPVTKQKLVIYSLFLAASALLERLCIVVTRCKIDFRL